MRRDTRVGLLVEILLDPIAGLDEKHDAAMQLASYNDEQVIDVVIGVSQDTSQDDII